jgi:UDP-glucose:(glucosyl)LPS alpha-1,2-glucosyltransferase
VDEAAARLSRNAVRERVAIVLPPSEAFSSAAAGAISLIALRLATPHGGFAPVVIGSKPPLPAFGDVPFHPVRTRWFRGYPTAVAHELSKIRPALVEVHNRPSLARRLARRWRVALFLNNDPQQMPAARTPAERRALLDRMAVVASSDYLRRRFLDGIAGEVEVLPNAFDFRELPPPVPRESLILFSGRVVADKGVDGFVRAAAIALSKLPGWRAEVIGADRFGPDSPETPFLRALRPEAEAAGVALLGYRPHAEVLAAMARAAIVVVPSRWPEPFGLVAVEAMASGVALICSPRGALPEVAGDAARYADPDDPAALAEAILALANDPAERAALGEAGRARARARFDLPIVLDALSALRERLLR